jgi:hypothetical protein
MCACCTEIQLVGFRLNRTLMAFIIELLVILCYGHFGGNLAVENHAESCVGFLNAC